MEGQGLEGSTPFAGAAGCLITFSLPLPSCWLSSLGTHRALPSQTQRRIRSALLTLSALSWVSSPTFEPLSIAPIHPPILPVCLAEQRGVETSKRLFRFRFRFSSRACGGDSTISDIAGAAQGTNASHRCIRTGTCRRRKRCAAALRLAMAPQTARPSVAEARPTRATRAGNASTQQGSAIASKGGSARAAATTARPLGGLSAPMFPLARSTQRAPRPSATAPATGGARRVRLNALAGRRVRARGTDNARTMGSACATRHTGVKRATYLALA
jgi:hypothetical protein